MSYAAINTQENSGLASVPPTMKINMLVNAKGKICLVHNEPFEATPIWIKYKKPSKNVDLLFDDGSVLTVYHNVPEQLDSYLINSNRVMIVRVENQKPVEGWETILLNELN